MKIAITGSSRGLGKSLVTELNSQGDFDIIQLNRSEGNNITNHEQIIKKIKDANIFINNAYLDYHQIILSYELFKLWRYKKKRIINISSTASDHLSGGMIEGSREPYIYGIWKSSLDTLSKNLAYTNYYDKKSCFVTNIRLGYMKTKMSDHRSYLRRIDTKKVAKTIIFILKQSPTCSEISIL